MKKLPIYKLTISENDKEESEVNFIALVDSPAIESNWMAFNKKMDFAKNPERGIVSGAAMIADLPIYRKDESMGEYYVVFDKETIEKIVMKFFRKGYNSNVNIMHDNKKVVEGVYVFESMFIDHSRGIYPPKGFEDLTDGSWFVSMKVDNKSVWDNIDLFNGFSVEGIFQYDFEESETDFISEVERVLNSIN